VIFSRGRSEPLFSVFQEEFRTCAGTVSHAADMDIRRTPSSFALMIISVWTLPAHAQIAAGQSASLRDAVAVGQMIVVKHDAGQETRGIVRAVDDESLTVDGRILAANTIDSIRRTDPLANGTWTGLAVGAGVTLAALASCGGYEFSEERGLCQAAALTSGLVGIPIAAFVGRRIDRAVGNLELYRRPPSRYTVRVHPFWTPVRLTAVASVSW
jgi:hypothetical protein